MSVYDTHVVRATQADLIEFRGHAKGGGAATDLTLTGFEAVGIKSIKHTGSTGIYKVTFESTFPALVDWDLDLGDTAPGNVKNFHVVLDYDSLDLTVANATVEFHVFNASGTLADIATTSRLKFEFVFRRATVKN